MRSHTVALSASFPQRVPAQSARNTRRNHRNGRSRSPSTTVHLCTVLYDTPYRYLTSISDEAALSEGSFRAKRCDWVIVAQWQLTNYNTQCRNLSVPAAPLTGCGVSIFLAEQRAFVTLYTTLRSRRRYHSLGLVYTKHGLMLRRHFTTRTSRRLTPICPLAYIISINNERYLTVRSTNLFNKNVLFS